MSCRNGPPIGSPSQEAPGRGKSNGKAGSAVRKAWLAADAWSGGSASRRSGCVAAGRLGGVAAARPGRGACRRLGLGAAAGTLESAHLTRGGPAGRLARNAGSGQEAGDDLSALLSSWAALGLAEAPRHQVCHLLRRLFWHPARTRSAQSVICCHRRACCTLCKGRRGPSKASTGTRRAASARCAPSLPCQGAVRAPQESSSN